MSDFADQVLILGMKQNKTNHPSKKSPLQKKFFLCHQCNFIDIIITEVIDTGVDVLVKIEISEQTPNGLSIIDQIELNDKQSDNTQRYYYCGLCGHPARSLKPINEKTIKYALKKAIGKNDNER